MDISFDYYRTFYYVARYRSFTKAADALMRNQPNVTRTIKLLEGALGCTLFERSNRTVRLTPEGERLFAHVQVACEQLQIAEEELTADNQLSGGLVSVGASEIALHTTLLPAIKTFKQLYPGIRVRIYNSSTIQAIAALKNRLVDLSIVSTPGPVTPPLTAEVLDSFQEIPICGRAYAHLVGRVLSMEELTRYPLICLANGTKTYGFYSQWFQENGLMLEPDVEAATSDQLLPLIKHDLGIGFLPEAMARDEIEKGTVFPLRLEVQVPERHVCLLRHQEFPLSIAAKKLEELLIQKRP